MKNTGKSFNPTRKHSCIFEQRFQRENITSRHHIYSRGRQVKIWSSPDHSLILSSSLCLCGQTWTWDFVQWKPLDRSSSAKLQQMIIGCFQAVTAVYLQNFLRKVVTVLNYETSFLLQWKQTRPKKCSKTKFSIPSWRGQLSHLKSKYFPVKST